MVLAEDGKGKPRIEVRELATRKLTHTVLLQTPNRHRAEKVLAGMYQRYDLDKVYLVMKCVDRAKPGC
jgi:hypothetical protein